MDRTRETLSRTDMAIVAARRLLLQAARTVDDGGDPPGLGTSCYRVRSIEQVVPNEARWREVFHPLMYRDGQVPAGSGVNGGIMPSPRPPA